MRLFILFIISTGLFITMGCKGSGVLTDEDIKKAEKECCSIHYKNNVSGKWECVIDVYGFGEKNYAIAEVIEKELKSKKILDETKITIGKNK